MTKAMKARIEKAAEAAYEDASDATIRLRPPLYLLPPAYRESIIKSFTAGLVAGGFIPAQAKGKRKVKR